MPCHLRHTWFIAALAGTTLGAVGCGDNDDNAKTPDAAPDKGVDGPPGADVNLHPHDKGNAQAGQAVFRMETFGNENFWTDAVKLPQGVVAAGFTPKQALMAGYNVNVDKLDAQTKAAIAAELQTDLSPANAPLLNSPATTVKLINANAVIGVVAVDSNNNGTIDITAGDKVGVACAFCHATPMAPCSSFRTAARSGARSTDRRRIR